MVKSRLILTCEHGGNQIPPAHRPAFRGAGRVLRSHRGWDIGALEGAQILHAELGAPLVFSQTSRLLIDLNRSLTHPQVFSEFSRGFEPSVRASLVARYYEPYRRRVARLMKGSVVHVSVHSFTPELHGIVRACHIGVLHDPRRARERRVAVQLQRELRRQFPRLNIYLNSPYRGYADGLTTTLRKGRPDYVGIELEINQDLIHKSLFPGIAKALRSISGF